MKLHSYLSPKCEVRAIAGSRGVYAKQSMPSGELVVVWGGVVYSRREIEHLAERHPDYFDNPVSVYEGFWLGPLSHEQRDDVEYMNHSCDPNVGVKGQILLFTRRGIEANEEVCFDYDTTEANSRPFQCNCGAAECRKTIDGSAWKDLAFQQRHAGWFSWHLQEKISGQKISSSKTTTTFQDGH